VKTKCRLSHWRETQEKKNKRKKTRKTRKTIKKKKKTKKKANKKKEKNTQKEKRKHVTVLQFVPNHRYAIHIWKIVPRNHAVISDL